MAGFDVVCSRCGHKWKCRSILEYVMCASCRLYSRREDIIVDRFGGHKLDMELIDKRLNKLRAEGRL